MKPSLSGVKRDLHRDDVALATHSPIFPVGERRCLHDAAFLFVIAQLAELPFPLAPLARTAALIFAGPAASTSTMAAARAASGCGSATRGTLRPVSTSETFHRDHKLLLPISWWIAHRRPACSNGMPSVVHVPQGPFASNSTPSTGSCSVFTRSMSNSLCVRPQRSGRLSNPAGGIARRVGYFRPIVMPPRDHGGSVSQRARSDHVANFVSNLIPPCRTFTITCARVDRLAVDSLSGVERDLHRVFLWADRASVFRWIKRPRPSRDL